MNINNKEALLNLKTKLDKSNNFIDYFLTIGVDPSVFYYDWLYTSEIDKLNTTYQSYLELKLLTKFPPIDKYINEVPKDIIEYCLPEERSVIQLTSKPKPRCYSFTLNNIINDKCKKVNSDDDIDFSYPRQYYSCLLCYENLTKYKELYDNYLSDNPEEKEKRIFNKKTIIKKDSMIVDSNRYRKYYIPKCLVISSVYPFFTVFENILKEIYDYSLSENTIPISKIIENYVLEIPAPPRGVYNIEYTSMTKQKVRIKQNMMNRLPLIHVPLIKIFNKFNANTVVDIIQHILLEKNILVFSLDRSELNTFIHGILSLLFPFEYQHSYVTTLQKDEYALIDSPSSFIFGLNDIFSNEFFTINGCTPSKPDILMIDLNNHELYQVSQNKSNNDDINKFPFKIRSCLERRLNDITKKWSQKKDIIDNHKSKENFLVDFYKTKKSYYKKKNVSEIFQYDDLYDFNDEISHAFLDFFADLFGNYKKFLNIDFYTSNEFNSVQTLFKVDEFLNQVPHNEREFYENFINETDMFTAFINKRMLPGNSKEMINILLFDEHINQRKSSKLFSQTNNNLFTNANDYDFIETYQVDLPRFLNQRELSYFDSTFKNTLHYANNGIIITKLPSFKGDAYLFKTPVFPLLMTNELYFLSDEVYVTPDYLVNQLKTINNKMVAQCYFGDVKIKQTDMENNINSCWMILWAMSFGYQDKSERPHVYKQLITIIEKSNYLDIEIMNLIFRTLDENGNDDMIFMLYCILIERNISPSKYVREIFIKIFDDNKHDASFDKGKIKNLIKGFFHINLNEDNNYRLRTIKSKYMPYLIHQKVFYYSFYSCANCSKIIDLRTCTFAKMKQDLFWLECPYCTILNLPKITVKIGYDINNNGLFEHSTCKYETFPLYSPLTLRAKLNELVNEFKITLDLEELTSPKYNYVLWNIIWYFRLKGLTYELFLPYEKYSNNSFHSEASDDIILYLIPSMDYVQCEIMKKEIIDKRNSILKKKKRFNLIEQCKGESMTI